MFQLSKTRSINRWRWFAFSVLCIFYAYEFFLRISPAILVDQLLQQYQISALGIAGFATSYFAGYLLMQVPAGLLFDRFGIKKVVVIALLTCVAGSLVFTLEHNFLLGLLGRLILGCGSAFAFVGAITFIRRYFIDRYFAVLVAVVISVGTIAGAFGQVFAVEIIHYLSWHLTIDGMATWGCILALAIAWVPAKCFEDTGVNQPKKQMLTIVQELCLIITNRSIWINGLIGGILYFPTSVIAATWGIEFFKKAFQLNDAVGSLGVTVLFVGWAIGGPVFSFLACRYRLEKLILSVAAVLAAAIFVVLLVQTTVTPDQLCGLLLLFGFFQAFKWWCGGFLQPWLLMYS